MRAISWDDSDDELTVSESSSGKVNDLEQDEVTSALDDDDDDATAALGEGEVITRVAAAPLMRSLLEKTKPRSMPPPPPPSMAPTPSFRRPPTKPPPPRPPPSMRPPPPPALASSVRPTSTRPPPVSAPPPAYVPTSGPPRGRPELDSLHQLPRIEPSRRPAINRAIAADVFGAVRAAPPVIATSVPAERPMSVTPTVAPQASFTPTVAPQASAGVKPRRTGRRILLFGLLLCVAVAGLLLVPKSKLERVGSVPGGAAVLALRARLESLVHRVSRFDVKSLVGGLTRRTLTITVSGPNAIRIERPQIYVDGALRCQDVPCRLTDLENGSHLVRVSAEGFETTADRAVSVSGDSDFNAVLTPRKDDRTSKPPPGESAASTKPPPAQDVTFDADQPVSADVKAPTELKQAAAPTRASAAHPRAGAAARDLAKQHDAQHEAPAADEAAAAPAADAKAIINISSSPAANIVIDGRPLGMTPKSVRVSPGNHTIVFVAGTDRKVESVNVPPGATLSVGAKF